MVMYSTEMSKRYSIADARRNLPSLVDEAESGAEVELTRRGKAVCGSRFGSLRTAEVAAR